ncbi:hypothetical protein C7271_05830 [filamentous cyanobacterium CCP5]|nr:hypothetical protein C7271_05830 [filamentous cyanobacterium CCP5]
MIWTVAAFYKFVALPDCDTWRSPLLDRCWAADLRGTILLAPEGINGTLAGSQQGIDQVLDYLRSDPRLADMEPKWSTARAQPFQRLKVKLKSEIVTLNQPTADPTVQVGTYLTPEEWNQAIADPEVLVIDTRNDYEVKIGSFAGAVNPQTQSFREFPDYVQRHLNPQNHRRVAMFCTGGIRCEKATAYLLSQGFEQVYHLRGGILKYLETIPEDESHWQGECFVFDERVAVGHGLEPGSYELCVACGHPISPEDKAADTYESGISCPHCWAEQTPEKRARQQARHQQRK